MKKDKTFKLSFKNKKIEGNWKVNDFGDWTLADFYFDGQDVQAIIGIGSLTIINPWQFDCPFLKTMIFHKAKNDNQEE